MGWLKQALTGADNSTVAIGRLISMMITMTLLMTLPLVAVATIYSKSMTVDQWRELLEALGIYVPLVVGAMTALIRITNPTEPQQKDGPNG